MGRDESMYDYLRPVEDRTYNPWADRQNELDPLFTVCDKDAEGAEPLYDQLEGEICRYVTKRYYGKAEYDRIKEDAAFLLETEYHTWDGRHKGIAEVEKEAILSNRSVHLVVQDGKLVGFVAYGWYDNARSGEEVRVDYSRKVFIPIGTDEIRFRLSYTNDGIIRCDYTKCERTPPVLTVCKRNSQGAAPLYDAIDGKECLYVTKQTCPDLRDLWDPHQLRRRIGPSSQGNLAWQHPGLYGDRGALRQRCSRY